MSTKMKLLIFFCVFMFLFQQTFQCVLLTPLIRFGRSIDEGVDIYSSEDKPAHRRHKRPHRRPHRHGHRHHRPRHHTKSPSSNERQRDTCRKGYCCEEEQCVKC